MSVVYRKRFNLKNDIKKINNDYYLDNKENILSKQKEYYQRNKEKLKAYKKEYYKKNKNSIIKNYIKYRKNRIESDKLYKFSINIKSLIKISLKSKGFSKKTRTYKILGCSIVEFQLYIESKFESWMNWDNHGLYNGELNYGWDIDHIIPLSSALTEDDIIKLNHYTNLQPLCSYTNRYIKKDKN